jgi:hypothetical protein
LKQSFTSLLTEHRIATSLAVSLKTSLPYSDRWTVKVRVVIQAALIPRTYALKLVIPSDLSDSVAFTCRNCRLTDSIPFDAYLITWTVVASTSGCLYFYGPVKFFILALHDNKEALSFLQQQVFDSFTIIYILQPYYRVPLRTKLLLVLIPRLKATYRSTVN